MSIDLDLLRAWMQQHGYDGLSLSLELGYRSDWFRTVFTGMRGVRRTVHARFIAVFGHEEYRAAFGSDAPQLAKPHPAARQQMAHLAVSSAVNRGLMLPASAYKCHGCNEPAKQHHHDEHYHPSNYLCVCPVCRTCHRQHHTGRKRLTFGVVPTQVGLIRIAIATR